MTARGENHWNAHITGADALAIREQHIAGARIVDLSAKFGASETAVRKVLTGESWATVTGGTNVLRRTHHGDYTNGRRYTEKQVETLRALAPQFRIKYEEWADLLGCDKTTVHGMLHGRIYRSGDQP